MNSKTQSETSSGFIPNLLKILGGLSVIVTFVLGIFQYKQALKLEEDKNFRTVVAKLASDKVEERLAAITNLGTYMNPESDYYNTAFDILINLVSTELNSNSLSAIRYSLEKAKKDRHHDIIQSLLNLEQNIFAYEYPIQYWSDNLKNQLAASKRLFNSPDINYLQANDKTKAQLFDLVKKTSYLTETAQKYHYVQHQLSEIEVHHIVIGRFVTSFLDNTLDENYYKNNSSEKIEGFKLFQNTLNLLTLTDANMRKSKIKNSALSKMSLNNVDFSNCSIENTSFTYTHCHQCNFSGCTIDGTLFDGPDSNYRTTKLIDSSFQNSTLNDVFFYWADLSGADFTGAKNLKPEYFYGAKNLNKAKFDQRFRETLDQSLISDGDFIQIVKQSNLSKQRLQDICSSLELTKAVSC